MWWCTRVRFSVLGPESPCGVLCDLTRRLPISAATQNVNQSGLLSGSSCDVTFGCKGGRERHPFSRHSVAQFLSKVSFPLENFHDRQLENIDDMSTQDRVVRPRVGLLQRDWPDGVRELVCFDKDANSEWFLWSTATASENS